MIADTKKLIRIHHYQMDQIVGKESVVQKDLSFSELMDLIAEVKNSTKDSIGNKNHKITTKILSDGYKFYDWYDNKFSGL